MKSQKKMLDRTVNEIETFQSENGALGTTSVTMIY